MRNICTMTDKETAEIGNSAFRLYDPKVTHPMGGDLYQSKKWKLHLFEDKKCEKIAIVDEHTPLKHIDDLWSKDQRTYISSGDDPFTPIPLYDWIEIDRHLVVRHFMRTNLDLFYKRKRKVLTENSQYSIFMKLEQFGFFGNEVHCL